MAPPSIFTGATGDDREPRDPEQCSDDATTVFIGEGRAGDRARRTDADSRLAAAPEKLEHFGIIYPEAMAGGTPVVAYRGGGGDSIVTPDVGRPTERDPGALGDAAGTLPGEPDLRARHSEGARERAERGYAYPGIVDRLEAWLASVVPEGARDPGPPPPPAK